MKKNYLLLFFFVFTSFIYAKNLKYRYSYSSNYEGYSIASFLLNEKEFGENELKEKEDYTLQFFKYESLMIKIGYILEPIKKLTKQQKYLLNVALDDWETESGDYYEVEVQEKGNDEKRIIIWVYYTSDTEYQFEAFYLDNYNKSKE